jgi:DeoR/GlpR family transcriptional regulator of sugar metabolism
MIPELGHQPGLVVMTNSLHVANALSELEHEPVLLMTGGTWDPHSDSFQGQVAEQVLRSYDFDQLFIGPTASICSAVPPPSTNCWA